MSRKREVFGSPGSYICTKTVLGTSFYVLLSVAWIYNFLPLD